MNESRLKEMGIPEDVVSKVMDEWNKTAGFIVHENEVNKERIKEYEDKLKGLEGFKGDNEQLTKRISELQAENKASHENFKKEMSEYKKSQAIKYALGTMKDGKPHDSGIVMGLLDGSKIEVDEDGNIIGGFDEQISALKKDKSFLFSESAQVRKGVTPPATVSVETKAEAPSMSFGARMAARTAHNASNV